MPLHINDTSPGDVRDATERLVASFWHWGVPSDENMLTKEASIEMARFFMEGWNERHAVLAKLEALSTECAKDVVGHGWIQEEIE